MSDSDSAQLAEFGYKQELHRTLGSFSSFAAGFSYISILTGMFQTSVYGFLFAGPAFASTWLLVLFGQFMVALQFAELSAHYPLAGSVYQWSKQVAGKAWSWNTGWMYMCAQIVTVPAVALAWQIVLPQVSTKFQLVGSPANSLDIYSKDFAENAVILGMIMILFTTVINIAGVSVMSRINNVGVICELVGASLLIVLFLFNVNRTPMDVLTNTAGTEATHGGTYFPWAWLVGAIMPLYVMYGFDTAGSLAEETDNPRKRAPRAVLQALGTAGVMGFLLIMFGTMAVSDKLFNGTAGANLSLTAITQNVFSSNIGKLFLIDTAIAIFVCCLAIHAMSVRILFAMGRDNNLPFGKQLASVSGKRRVPVTPAVFVGILSLAVLAFNIYNRYAVQIIISLGIIFMYLAYLGVNVPLFRKRMNGWPDNAPTNQPGLFRLGGWAKITNALAIIYGAGMVINLAWPRDYFYGTLWYQQYGPILGVAVVVIGGLALYYGYQKDRMAVLPEHQATGGPELSAAIGEPPPIHGGP
jgi:urea carboxylase system permease